MKYPFVHEELDVKQVFLNSARAFAEKKGDVDKQFAAALIYANLADYLGTHLLESLKLACSNATRTYFNGVIVLKMKESSNLPLGKVIEGLDMFIFPSKELILPLLKKIKANRDTIMHGLVKSPRDKLAKIDDVFVSLIDDVEQLVTYIDDIYRSLPPRTVLDNFGKNEKVEDPNMEQDEAIESKPASSKK